MIGSIFALHIAGCCGAAMLVSGIVMVLFALFFLTLWIVECKPKRSTVVEVPIPRHELLHTGFNWRGRAFACKCLQQFC
ncbi:hypothetical protein CLV88_11391 [Shimia abyssi]|uniref:Uncharacterized protein n=1 Tax=Shimia abyssi TaxID=1662395 RepID=A0A2P8F8H1_9RHOB|nr:hypothetical protein CLV88_11391 [Shimia abyssi]